MRWMLPVFLTACQGGPPSADNAFAVAPPPGVGGITLSAPSSFVSGDTVELTVTAADLSVGDRVDFGFAPTTGAGSCPHRLQTGGRPCLDIAGRLEVLGTAFAADEGGTIVARLSTTWTTSWDVAYTQAFLFRGTTSATSQVEAVDVVQPWESHSPRLDQLEAELSALQAALAAQAVELSALQSDLSGLDGEVGVILADYVTHAELDALGGASTGSSRPASPAPGALYVSPSGDVEVFDGTGWRTITATDICGDGYVAASEVCDDGNQLNTDACTNACEAATCGDGYVQPGEPCDDGNLVNTDACTNSCQVPSSLFVFVTSQTWSGALGGVAGADARCQAAAQAAGRPGTFAAFVSTSAVHAKDRIEDAEYRRFDGVVVASNLAQITGAPLSAAVLKDEFGNPTPVDSFDVWTGSNYLGLWFGSTNDDCNGWTSSAGNGITGGSQRTEHVLWKAWNREGCSNGRRLYCFQLYP